MNDPLGEHEAAFIAQLVSNPDDDTTRLVYSDWLSEQGREDEATLMRLQTGWKDRGSG